MRRNDTDNDKHMNSHSVFLFDAEANIPRGRANTCGVNERVENKSRKVAFAMTRRTTSIAVTR